jgi:anti-anti-sigma factor
LNKDVALDLQLSPIEADGLSAAVAIENHVITVGFKGSCDMETNVQLEELLKSLHGEALRLGVGRVVFDCRELYFMNSTSLKSFVNLISRVKSIKPKERYGVEFQTNEHLAWQRRSLDAIRRYAPDIVRVA